MKRKMYHDTTCQYEDASTKTECVRCRGRGGTIADDDGCPDCNGYGWYWGVNGYNFMPYTLKPVVR